MKIKDQQYGIFLSSVDHPAVREYRLAAKAIVESDEFRHLWKPVEMGNFSPDSKPSLDFCRARVLECYVYVGLFGPIYGSVNDKVNMSYTEYEYSVAREESQKDGNFRLAVFLLPFKTIVESMSEKDFEHHTPYLERQRQFKNRVNSEITSRDVVDLEDFRKHFTLFMRSLKHPPEPPTGVPSITQPHKLLADESNISFDAQLVLKHGVDELDQELVKQFLQTNLAQDDLRKKGAQRQSLLRQLEVLGLAREEHPTLGTFLCFAPGDLIMPYFPACSLELYVYDGLQKGGTPRTYFDATQDNLLRLYDVGMGFFRTNAALKRYGVVGSDARDDLEIPLLALREALANALVHRDYERDGERDQPTRIEIFSDRVEITSFGGLIEGVDLRLLNMDPEKVAPRRRYHMIARIFRYMNVVELRGGGVSTMRQEMAKRNQSAPLLTLQDVNGFRSLTVRFLRPIDLSGEDAALVTIDPSESPSSRTSSKRRMRHNVMLSSTTRDLPAHRKEATDAIFRRGMFPLVIETAATTPRNAIQFSLDLVDEADVYVGIFGFRYGHVPDDPDRNPDKLSVTELEYRRAVERGIPTLIFLIDDDHPGPAKVSEQDTFYEPDADHKAKLKRLKDELTTKYVVSFFKSPQELSAKVYQALDQLVDDGMLTTASDDDPSSTGSPLPAPPEPYIPHAYVLTRKFFGREDELKLLDTWGASTDTTMIVEAIGGVGKSALTWEWFNRHHTDYEASFWWSFYESDSAVTNFLRHALAYLEGKAPDDYDARKFEDNERRLLHLLTHRRCLLVLDGIERILVAYHRLNAAQMTDDAAETEPVRAHGGAPGSPETADRIADRTADDTRRRACTDPRHGALLQKLATCAPTKILISTRLIPADLQDKSNRLIEGVRHHHLGGMLPDDALAYIRHLGVTGDPARLKAFMEQFGRHSLLIGIIAGRINDYFPAPGDFDTWYADEGATLKLHDLDLQQRRTHILAYALHDLKPELKQFLGQIAAFSFPLDYPTLAAFNPYAPPRPLEPRKPYLSSFASAQKRAEHEKAYRETPEYSAYQQAVSEYEANLKNLWRPPFHAALRDLEDRGLLQWDRTAPGGGRFDLHPVVRGYAFDDLPDADRRTAYERIRNHFEQQPAEDLDTVQDLSGLRRSIEIYRALVGAGLLDQAASFYGSRLADFLRYQLNAYHAMLELLGPLFPQGPAALPALKDPAVQSTVVNDLAGALDSIGQSDQARQLYGLTFNIDLARRAAVELGIGLSNYGSSLLSDRRLAAAHRVYTLALDLAAAADHADNLAYAHLRLLSLHVDTGDWIAAEAAYQAFVAAPPERNSVFWQAEAEWYRSELLFYRGDDSGAITAQIEQAWALAERARHVESHRELLTLRGHLALRLDQPEAAAGYFAEALRLARQAGTGAGHIVGGLARAYARQGRHADARSLLPEADAIDQAEVYLLFNEPAAARDAALTAYELAWADGPPYSFWYALERAKKVLDALNVPYPDLPPFDPSKVEKIPHENEIRAFLAELQAKKAAKPANP